MGLFVDGGRSERGRGKGGRDKDISIIGRRFAKWSNQWGDGGNGIVEGECRDGLSEDAATPPTLLLQ